MAVTNSQIAEILRQYASTILLEGADRFKVKAYRRAAETVETLPEEATKLLKRGEDLKQYPGIGQAISDKIEEIVRTGKLPQLEKAVAALSPELVELASKPSLDPKTVLRVYKKLKINSLSELKKQLDSGEIGEQLGARTEFQVRQGLTDRPRMLLWTADALVPKIEAYLKSIPQISKFAQTGSLRRRQETIGDISYLVTGPEPSKIFKRFEKFGAVQSSEPVNKNEHRFQLSAGRTVTLTWTKPEQWGLSLFLKTGSATHLDDIREKLRADTGILGPQFFGKSAESEKRVYEKLKLSFIEPELREGRGEVAAATKNKLPQLVELKDIRGDLHMHTTASDGANTLQQMAEAAIARGYEYISITDHSQSLKITNGLTSKRLLEQIKAIDKMNSKLKNLTILKSAEVDILEDGKLDFPNSILKELDLTICSIHSRFALNKEQQTVRILRAMDNRYFNILGHATGRLLLKREGFHIDIERVIKHAAASGCYFEINSSPDRLDLSDEHAKLAKDAGVKIAVNTDAHSVEELSFISAGLSQARRAWLESTDVLNTISSTKLLKTLKR